MVVPNSCCYKLIYSPQNQCVLVHFDTFTLCNVVTLTLLPYLNGSLQWESYCRYHTDEGTGRHFGRSKIFGVLPKREETSPEANISSYFRETAELGMLHGKMEEYVLWVVALKSLEQNLRMYYGYKALESVELYSIKKSIICLLLSISLFIITNKK